MLCCACCSLALGELVCPQLEHPCEPWCFAVLAVWPLASLCARSWNTLVSLGALLCLLLFAPGELVCPQLEHPCEPWCFAVLVALCPLASLCARSWNTLVSLGALRFGKLVRLSHWNILVSLGVLLWLLLLFHRILPFQHGTFWLPKMDLPPTNWDTTQLEALVKRTLVSLVFDHFFLLAPCSSFFL